MEYISCLVWLEKNEALINRQQFANFFYLPLRLHSIPRSFLIFHCSAPQAPNSKTACDKVDWTKPFWCFECTFFPTRLPMYYNSTVGPPVMLILGSGKTRVSLGRVTRINNNTSFFGLKNRVSRGPTLYNSCKWNFASILRKLV